MAFEHRSVWVQDLLYRAGPPLQSHRTPCPPARGPLKDGSGGNTILPVPCASVLSLPTCPHESRASCSLGCRREVPKAGVKRPGSRSSRSPLQSRSCFADKVTRSHDQRGGTGIWASGAQALSRGLSWAAQPACGDYILQLSSF